MGDRDAGLALLGRDDELNVLSVVIDGAAGAAGGAVVVLGEAGIGKSALLSAAGVRAAADGMTVLATVGLVEEEQIPFAALHRLLGHLVDVVDLGAEQRAALHSAFGINDSPAPAPARIAMATLDLVASAAAAAPVVLIVDDAHWLDRASSDAIAFVGRRLSYEPIALLVGARPSAEWSQLPGLPRLTLSPLSPDASAQLLDAAAPGLARHRRGQVLGESAGNPLALIELPTALVQQPGNGPALGERLPLSMRLQNAFASRTVQLPKATRMLLLVAAADGVGELGVALDTTAELRSCSASVRDLEPAISAGIVTLDEETIRFRHPLIRSAIYQAASLTEQNDVHAALHLRLGGDPDRAVWHLAAATVGRDEHVASELEAAAARARRRGALGSAVEALRRAAQMSPGSTERSRRLLSAALLAFELGRGDIVMPLLEMAESLELTALQKGRVRWIREMIDPKPFTATEHVQDLIALAIRSDQEEEDPDLALDLLWLVTSRLWWAEPSGDVAALRTEALRAAEGITSLDEDLRVLAITAYAAPIASAERVLRQLSRLSTESEADPERLRLPPADAAVIVGAFDIAAPLLAATVTALRQKGWLGHLPGMLALQGTVAARAGDWQTAVPAIEEAARIAEEHGKPLWIAHAQVAEAIVAAAQGDLGRVAALTRDAESVLLPLGASYLLAGVQMARGAAALAVGDNESAYAHLIRLFDRSDPAFHSTMQTWGLGDLAEAAKHVDRRGDALRHVDAAAKAYAGSPAMWPHLSILRAQASLADDVDAEARFRRVLDINLAGWPMPRARALLDYGSWLRRQRRARDSRPTLRAALETFEALRAVPWAERARSELRASGETRRSAPDQIREQLTPQELQIAEMAAAGLTNREIGQQLFLSHRTVSTHLYKIFPKLGVTSRAQLAAQLRTPNADRKPGDRADFPPTARS